MSQMSFDDGGFDAVRRARDDGIRRADDHANDEWRACAENALSWCIASLPAFTADHVWARMRQMGAPPIATHNPSALGPVFMRAARDGRIEKTGRYPLTVNPTRHRNLTEWRRCA